VLPPPNRWSLIERIAAAYFVLLGLISLLFFEELVREFGQSAADWAAQNRFRAFEAVSVLGALLAIFIGIVGLRLVRYFGQRSEQQLARWATLVKPEDMPNLELDFRASQFQLATTIFQIVGGTALLFGAYSTYQNLITMRDGQVTDRFIRAVEQLGAKDKDGNPAPEIRLGGVYGLRRVAQDSREDYQPIRKILNDYVRINAPWPPSESAKTAAPTPAAGATPGLAPTPAPFPTPRADIQATLEFLAQPIAKWEKFSASAQINLPEADLRGAFLDAAHLEKAILTGAHLHDARLDGADLSGADLSGAHLEGAFLAGADLSGANLSGTHLRGAVLDNSNLKNAVLRTVDLSGAHLDSATLNGADLSGAHLERAWLMGVTLSGARLDGAQLEGTVLYDVDLSQAVGLTQEQINLATGNGATKSPPNLKRPPGWAG